jgi:hypothetical protein
LRRDYVSPELRHSQGVIRRLPHVDRVGIEERAATGDAALGTELDKLASESVTRIRHTRAVTSYAEATADPLSRLEALTELKTAWHPVGA